VARAAASAAASPGLDEARLAQDRERLAERHRGDLQPGRELGLGREPLARREQAGADRLADAADDPLDGALRLEGAEGDLTRLDRHML
jgi:hypothetical protein